MMGSPTEIQVQANTVELQLAVAVIKTGFTVIAALLSLLITATVALYLRLEKKAEATAALAQGMAVKVEVQGARLGRAEADIRRLSATKQ